MAGLISDADRSDANRIPLLGDVPMLGRLFSSQKDDRQKTEIVMSITPHLIRNIQRKSVAAEAFWSGTESTLRTRPVQLRNTTATPVQGATAAPAEAPTQSAGALQTAVDTSGVQLSWKGPRQAKVGQPFKLELEISSEHALRAAPLQLAYHQALLEVISVTEGDFFTRTGKGNFSHVVDSASGRASVGIATADGGGVNGGGRLLTVELRPKSVAAEAEFSVVGLTPIGSGQAVQKPVLPITHRFSVEP
jgi:general secretion pathway protein D